MKWTKDKKKEFEFSVANIGQIIEHTLGTHPNQLGKPPIKLKVLTNNINAAISLFGEAMDILPKSTIKKISDRHISLKNGSTISFDTCNNLENKLRGIKFDIFYIELDHAFNTNLDDKGYMAIGRCLATSKNGGRVYVTR